MQVQRANEAMGGLANNRLSRRALLLRGAASIGGLALLSACGGEAPSAPKTEATQAPLAARTVAPIEQPAPRREAVNVHGWAGRAQGVRR